MKPTAYKWTYQNQKEGCQFTEHKGRLMAIEAAEYPEIVKSEPLYVIPKGYKLVPVEPTEEMIKAGYGVYELTGMAKEMWDEMIEAAPSIDKIEGDL